MGKVVHNDVLDALFTEFQTANGLTLNTSEPASRSAAVADNLLNSIATPSYTGPADGDTSGRKITVNALSGLTAGSTGTATHIALVDASNVLYVTTCSSTSITSGNTVDIGSWDVEVADPT